MGASREWIQASSDRAHASLLMAAEVVGINMVGLHSVGFFFRAADRRQKTVP
jgi:hypothetical protein